MLALRKDHIARSALRADDVTVYSAGRNKKVSIKILIRPKRAATQSNYRSTSCAFLAGCSGYSLLWKPDSTDLDKSPVCE